MAFSGSHRYVIDYLMEEVLRQREPGVQAFLQQMAVMNGMDELTETGVYEICIQGHPGSRRARQLSAPTFAHRPDGTTLLVTPVTDQAALYGLLSRIRDLGTTLLSVRRQEEGASVAGVD